MLTGFDSAFGPSLAAARAARAAGNTFWFGYIGGPGVFHKWTTTEWAVLRTAGLTPGTIWVPTYGLAENPTQAAADAVGVAESAGLFGAVMLDTEEAMKKSAHLVDFVDAFCAEITKAGRAPVVYDGAGYVAPGAAGFFPEWGTTAQPSTSSAIQYGPAVRYGTSVDVDACGPSFPLGSWLPPVPGPPAPTPVPGPPVVHATVVNTWTNPEGTPMATEEVTIAVASGYGFAITDIPFTNWTGADPTINGSDPAVDGHYTAGEANAQNRGGDLLVEVTDCALATPTVGGGFTKTPFTGPVTVFIETTT